MKKRNFGWCFTMLLLCPAACFATCNFTNAIQQTACLTQQATQAAQQRAQQQAAQERVQEEARQRAQEAAEQRAQQQAAQERAQEEARQRAAPQPSYTPQQPQTTRPSYQPPPSQSYTPRTYTPGAAASTSRSGPAANSSTSGATTYTPRVYTPGRSGSTAAAETSKGGSSSTPAVTVYTPRAAGTSSTGREAQNGPNGGSSSGITHSNGATVYTPSARRADLTVANSTSSGRDPSTFSAQSRVAVKLKSEPFSPAPTIQSINAARSNLGGINKTPIPPGNVKLAKNGNYSVQTADGRQFGLRKNGSLASYSGGGKTVTFGGHGRIRTVHTQNFDISRGVHGQRAVVVRRPDRSVLVSIGPRAGYIERPITLRGRPFVERSYVMGTVTYTRVFTTYTFHNVALINYVPTYSYAPAFYGWAYYPWQAAVAFAWGLSGAPWYGYYGPYFAFSPTYPGASMWLTDYYLGQTLAAAYQYDTQPVQGPDYVGGDPEAPDELDAQNVTPISPEIKQEIADQAQQQLAYENAGSANPSQAPTLDGLPQVLVPNHLFVASSPLNVSTPDNQNCDISIGDVLKLTSTPADSAATADLIVTSSRKSDCPAGTEINVSLVDLQEMQNNFRAQLDAGLQKLYSSQGQGGLPAAPPSANAPPPRPGETPPPEDPTVQGQVAAAQQQADTTEAQVTQGAFSQETSAHNQ